MLVPTSKDGKPAVTQHALSAIASHNTHGRHIHYLHCQLAPLGDPGSGGSNTCAVPSKSSSEATFVLPNANKLMTNIDEGTREKKRFSRHASRQGCFRPRCYARRFKRRAREAGLSPTPGCAGAPGLAASPSSSKSPRTSGARCLSYSPSPRTRRKSTVCTRPIASTRRTRCDDNR
jgi:hypothetical protein